MQSTKWGHMEKQETEMKRKLEMETENGIGNGTKNALVQCFLHSLLLYST